MQRNCLIIFYRNPELGKVKTRLAATVGGEKALAIYLMLVAHTREISQPNHCDKFVYYSEFIDQEDQWKGVSKKLQLGKDLGERMQNAFAESFSQGYHHVCIIGTDCAELQPHHLGAAFALLKKNSVVIGPAVDGGYYLLGMNQLRPELFQNKQWSSSTVFEDTKADLEKENIPYALLPTLNDVDEEKDLPPRWR